MKFAILSLLLFVPLQDPEVEAFKELVKEARIARKFDVMDRAKELDVLIKAKLRKALDEYRDARKDGDKTVEKRLFARVVKMTESMVGDQVRLGSLNSKFAIRLVDLLTMEERKLGRAHEAALSALRNELKAMGAPEGFKSIIPKPLKKEEDATSIYQEAFDLLEKITRANPGSRAYMDDVLDRAKAKGRVREGREHLKRFVPVVEIVRRARGKRVRFPLKYEDGPSMLLSHIAPYIRLSKMLRASALSESVQGNHKSSRDLCLLGFEVAVSNQEEPILITALVNTVTLTVAADTFQELYLAQAIPDGEIDAFLKLIDRIHPRKMYARAFQGEACTSLIIMEDLVLAPVKAVGGLPALETIFREDILRMIQVLRKTREHMLGKADLPPPLKRDEMAPLTALLLPAITRCIKNMNTMEARIETLRLGLAARRFEIKNGRLPAKLAELVPKYLSELPKDPFTGGEFRYTHNRIYSLGKNKKDDGGKKADIFFRLK